MLGLTYRHRKSFIGALLVSIFLGLGAAAQPAAAKAGEDRVRIEARLSQSKLVQHGEDIVYLDITLSPPEPTSGMPLRRPSDLMIILDRSGSMSEVRKMPYAKAAIRDVLSRLGENDRFALVTFSDTATVASQWLNVDPSNRYHLNRLVDGIGPVGGTNMGEGLQSALRLLQYGDSERARKILLLSDGQANQGVTHPDLLAGMAGQATQYGAVLSTIGMGLGFNESLLSKLADHGMGHYSYLEDLSGLAAILNRDLEDTRQLYASGSTLEIRLGEGVELLDAGGYPLSRGKQSVTITTGQLLGSTAKHFVMTFKVPNARTGSIELGDLHLDYTIDGRNLRSGFEQKLQLAIVEPERVEEARKSIDREVYQQSWLENNLGRMKKRLGQWLREGKREQAEKEISDYQNKLQQAEQDSSVPLASPAVAAELRRMESQVDEAFSGASHERQTKQNRAAKRMQYEALKEQRK